MALTDEQHIKFEQWLQQQISLVDSLAKLYPQLQMSLAQQKFAFLRVQDKLKELT